MYPGEFEDLFRAISKIFTLETVAKKEKSQGRSIKRNPNTPMWDTLESIKDCDFIDLENGSTVSCEHFFKKPFRIMFFILIHELESRLYRIHKWHGKLPIKELDSLNINDLIRTLVNDQDLISLQDLYPSKSTLKEDLKAISSFRNVIVHTNRKLLDSVNTETIITRKKQIRKLLETLQQVLDNMNRNDVN